MSDLVRSLGRVAVLGLVSIAPLVHAQTDDPVTDTRPSVAPDIRDDESKLKLQKGNFVVVPIPISTPTLDTGLIAGAAKFYGQTEEQSKTQPASVTGVAAMYTSNDSRAAAIVQQNYWRNDSLILTNFVAVDWFSEAVIFGPSLRWIFNDHLF